NIARMGGWLVQCAVSGHQAAVRIVIGERAGPGSDHHLILHEALVRKGPQTIYGHCSPAAARPVADGGRSDKGGWCMNKWVGRSRPPASVASSQSSRRSH